MQHQSTWRRSCTAVLPIETLLEPPVGFFPFRPPPPDFWATVLDNNALPAIAQALRYSGIQGQFIKQRTKPAQGNYTGCIYPRAVASHTSTSLLAGVCVCVCVCMCVYVCVCVCVCVCVYNMHLIVFLCYNSAPEFLRLLSPVFPPSYTPTPRSPLLYAGNRSVPLPRSFRLPVASVPFYLP